MVNYLHSVNQALENARYNSIMLLLQYLLTCLNSTGFKWTSLRNKISAQLKLVQSWMSSQFNALNKNSMKYIKNSANYWKISRKCSKNKPKLTHNLIYWELFLQLEAKYLSYWLSKEEKHSKSWKWHILKI